MKNITRIIASAALLSAAFCSQSCLKNQTDLFDSTAAARMQASLSEAQSVLTSPQNGWAFEYFVGNSTDRGGYNLTLKFTEDKVTATSERDLGLTTETYYKLTTDDGPVLSFDTYSAVLHEFATPAGTSNQYQGLGGDFEFLILEATAEKVVLKGKRSGKISTMYPLAESPESYLQGISESIDNFVIGEIEGTINGKNVAAEIDLDNHQIYFYEVDAEGGEVEDSGIQVPYIYTKTGIKFYEPIEFAGGTMTYVDFDLESRAVTNTEVTANLKGIVPADYLPYSFFEGDYDFKTYFGVKPVKLTKAGNKTYKMSGLSSVFDLTLEYNSAKGRLSLKSQIVGKNGDYDVMLCPWSLGGGGSLYVVEGVGLEFVWNMDSDKPVFTFESDGAIAGFSTDSFILWNTSGGKSAGAASTLGSWFVWGSYQWPYIIRNGVSNTLTKK